MNNKRPILSTVHGSELPVHLQKCDINIQGRSLGSKDHVALVDHYGIDMSSLHV